MIYLSQRQTLQAAKLKEQVEAEEKRPHDDMEGPRTQRQLSPLSRENLRRELWVFNELAWKREVRIIDSFCWRET